MREPPCAWLYFPHRLLTAETSRKAPGPYSPGNEMRGDHPWPTVDLAASDTSPSVLVAIRIPLRIAAADPGGQAIGRPSSCRVSAPSMGITAGPRAPPYGASAPA